MRAFTPSPREAEIIALVLQFVTPKEIGVRLGISHNTVKVHFNRIYRAADISGNNGEKLVKLATMMYRRGNENS